MKSFFLFLFFLFAFHDSKAQFYAHNLDTAKMEAAANGQHILIVFAGSDWCKPCMQFKQEVLENETFQTYASKHLKVLYLDFPARKKNALSPAQTVHNEALAEKYNKGGAFPKIVLVDANEKWVADIPYKLQTADKFIANCQTHLP